MRFLHRVAMSAAFLSFAGIVLLTGCGTTGSSPTPTPPSPAIVVAVQPATVGVLVGARLSFGATVSNTTDARVTWTVSEANSGAQVSGGQYVAPRQPGTYHVRATSVADPTRYSEATISVRTYDGTLSPRAGNLPEARYLHTATLLGDGTVLLVGGGSAFHFPASTVRFDPGKDTVTVTASLQTPRIRHTANLMGDGRVLIVGGYNERGQPVASTEVYDAATDRFLAGTPLLHLRQGHTATILQDGRTLIVGGLPTQGYEVGAVAEAELFTKDGAVVTPLTGPTQPRWLHTATRLKDGRVLVVGGMSYRCFYCTPQTLATAEVFDPATGTWSSAGTLHFSRMEHIAVLLDDGRVLIAGGSTTDSRIPDEEVTQAELWDPATGQFTLGAILRDSHSTGEGVLLNDGRVLLVGGFTTTQRTTERAELYDPVSGRVINAGGLRDWNQQGTATLLPDGRVLIAGGSNSAAASAFLDFFQ